MEKMKQTILEVVIYDESEYFRDYKHPDFMYPWINRKTVAQSEKFKYSRKTIIFDKDYEYNFLQAKFQRSETCLEPHFMDQMNFIGDLYESFHDIIQILGSKDASSDSNDKDSSPSDEHAEDCDGEFFSRLRFSNSYGEKRSYNDYYPYGDPLNDPFILFEIEISQNSVKTKSERSSTAILDFLGDIGGFKEALMIMLAGFGEFFSAKMFIKKVGESLYREKV